MRSGGDPPSDRKLSILIVGGDVAVRELLADVLVDSGFTVVQTADDTAAIEHARHNRIDLVIADLAMADREGRETILLMTREQPQIKVIALSGYQRVAGRDQAASFGAVATIRKPFALEEVVRTVATVLESESRSCQRGATGRK